MRIKQLLKITAAAFSLLLLKGRTSTSGKHRDAEPDESDAGDEEPGTAQDGGQLGASLIRIGQIETPEAADGAHSGGREEKQSLYHVTRWQAIFTGLIFVVTGLYAVVSFYQLRAMHGQIGYAAGQLEAMNKGLEQTRQIIDQSRRMVEVSEEMARQNKDLVAYARDQAESARLSAGATISSTETAARGVQLAAEGLGIGQRAYVMVQGMSITGLAVGQTPAVVTVFENAGATPAYDVAIQLRVEERVLPLPRRLPPPDPKLWQSTADMASKGTFEQKVEMKGRLSPQELWAIDEGRFLIYAYGYIRYHDAFDRRRLRTEAFCGYYQPKSRGDTLVGDMNVCPHGNSRG